jgi:ribosomal protein L37E
MMRTRAAVTCQRCGYNLRATPVLCPECGRKAAPRLRLFPRWHPQRKAPMDDETYSWIALAVSAAVVLATAGLVIVLLRL